MKEKLAYLLKIAEEIELDDATDIILNKSTRGYASVTIYKRDARYRAVRPAEGEEVEFLRNENKEEKF